MKIDKTIVLPDGSLYVATYNASTGKKMNPELMRHTLLGSICTPEELSNLLLVKVDRDNLIACVPTLSVAGWGGKRGNEA